VLLACVLALFFPMVHGLGLSLTPGAISEGPNWVKVVLVAVTGLLSFIVSLCRKHEGPLGCFIDSLGLPALLLVASYAYEIV
jgi:hypothetical protein